MFIVKSCFSLVFQGDLKQFLRISKSSDEKLKPHPISTRTKVGSSCDRFIIISPVALSLRWSVCLISGVDVHGAPQVSICAQVARGMQHLSDRGFVHKDLAARNCLISGQRHVKVSALSLSKDVYNRYQLLQSI